MSLLSENSVVPENIESMSLIDITRHIAAANDELDKILDGPHTLEFSDANNNVICDMSYHLATRTPETVADAAALLMTISSDFRSAVDNYSTRCEVIEAYAALGRVIRFLAGHAGIDCSELAPAFFPNSIDGLDMCVRIDWWLERFLDAKGTLHLSEDGKTSFVTSVDDADQAERFRKLFDELPSLDRERLDKATGKLAWNGLGSPFPYEATIPGHRWAVTRERRFDYGIDDLRTERLEPPGRRAPAVGIAPKEGRGAA